MSARGLEILRGGLSFIRDLLVLDDMTLIQAGQARPFNPPNPTRWPDGPAAGMRPSSTWRRHASR